MKKFLLLFLLALASTPFLQAQVSDGDGEDGSNSVRLEELKKGTSKQLEIVLLLVEKRNYAGLATNVLYSGTNPARHMRTHMVYEDAFDRLETENMLNRIHSWMEKAAVYHLNKFEIIGSKESAVYRWDVEFASKKGKVQNHTFDFYLLNGKYLLSSVE